MITENLLRTRHCTEFLKHAASWAPNDFRKEVQLHHPSYRGKVKKQATFSQSQAAVK